MFWGLVLEPGKRYSTTVDKSFHVSMAALDCSSVKSDSEILSVIVESDGQENILCNLSKQQKLLQSHLDLNFMTGDKVAFEIKGNAVVHLSGYLVPEDDDDYLNMNEEEEEEEDEEEEEEETEELPEKNQGKLKGKRKFEQGNEMKKKKLKMTEELDDDDEEEDDSDEEEDDDSDEEEDDDSDEEEDDSEEDEEEVQVQAKKQKTPQSVNKKPQQTPNKQTPSNKQQQSANVFKQNTTPLVNGSTPNQQQSNKKNKKKGNQGQETPKTPSQNDVKQKNQKTPGSDEGSPQKKKLEGGVIVKDLKEGNGPVAKSGQMVAVYYQGRLKSNNKIFDECKKGGPPFKFKLGKGEVIKGWDIGVAGMKVGGTRTISCPPNMAYGQKGSPPQIPPNSALVFQVELKSVH